MGLFNEPPTPGSSYPDIPIPNFVEAAKQAAAGLAASGAGDSFVVKLWREFVETMHWAIGFLVGQFDWLAAFFVESITAMQGTKQPGMVALMAAVLGDLLGIEFSSDELVSTLTAGGRLKTMEKAGGWLFDTLATEFTGQALDPGMNNLYRPAERFLGFLIEFAVRQGNLAMIAQMIPSEFNPFMGLREYGELLARNLGLGRLARQALRPLMQVTIADPLTQALHRQFRPKLLSPSTLIKAYKRGAITRDQLADELAWQGWNDERMELMITEEGMKWHARELLELVRLGEIDETEAIARLQEAGIGDADASELWQAYKGEAAQTIARTYVTELLREVREGWIDNPTAQSRLAKVPLLSTEVQMWQHIFGELAERPRRHLTESEVERAFLGGIIDMTTAQAFWSRLGYSDEDVGIHTLLLLQKQSGSNRTRAGSTPHKHLTEAQLEKAYNNGILNLAQLAAGWAHLGYTPDDVQVLSALVQLKTAGPGETLFPTMTTP